MKQRIRVAAIITNNSEVLLVKHVHPKTKYTCWVPPGGGVEEKDNSIYTCAVRETWEETGLNIVPKDIIYIREFIDEEHLIHHLEIFIRSEVMGGELTIRNIVGNGPDEDYIKDVKWICKDELKEMNIFPEIIKTQEFWNDIRKDELNTKYLGRQKG